MADVLALLKVLVDGVPAGCNTLCTVNVVCRMYCLTAMLVAHCFVVYQCVKVGIRLSNRKRRR